ncbi:MAG: MerR family transcriptional regulator [Alistipes sp.]|nr:MerR family transcriptional regulator [Alistipes sp.]
MAKLLYTMGEVTEMFDVNASLIRYWESKFDCIRPRKNKKGNRLFTPEDVENLKLIYHLVKEKGMTLEGANRTMKHNRRAVAGDASLLERLQNIRAMLVEVRESLKDDGKAAYVQPDEPVDQPDPQGAEEMIPVQETPAAAAQQPSRPISANRAVGDMLDPEPEQPSEEQSAVEPSDVELPEVENPVGKPAPKRRRRKSDEEKELFPFYEQSLF